jgi:hypothetical protein
MMPHGPWISQFRGRPCRIKGSFLKPRIPRGFVAMDQDELPGEKAAGAWQLRRLSGCP